MQQTLAKLSPIKGGNILDVLTVERMTAIQDAILELAGRKDFSGGVIPWVAPGRAGASPGRFKVTYDPGTNRVSVRTGYVIRATKDGSGTVLRPMEATLDGTLLSDDPKPYWELHQRSGEMEVVCVFYQYKARMELKGKDEDLDLDPCERAWQVAKLTFPDDGSVKIEQTWQSDILWIDLDESCDSSDSDSGVSDGSDGSDQSDHSDKSDDSDGSDKSDDSGGSDDFSSDSSDDSGGGDSSESSSGDCTAPKLSNLKVTIYDIGGNGPGCFVDAVTLTPVVLVVTCMLSNLPQGCSGRMAVKFSFGQFSKWTSVFAEGEIQGEFGFITGGIPLFACSSYEVSAEVQRGVEVTPSCDPKPCKITTWFKTPGLCANGGSCDESSSSSSSSTSSFEVE